VHVRVPCLCRARAKQQSLLRPHYHPGLPDHHSGLTAAVVPGLTRRDQKRPLFQEFRIDPNDSELPKRDEPPMIPRSSARYVPCLNDALLATPAQHGARGCVRIANDQWRAVHSP